MNCKTTNLAKTVFKKNYYLPRISDHIFTCIGDIAGHIARRRIAYVHASVTWGAGIWLQGCCYSFLFNCTLYLRHQETWTFKSLCKFIFVYLLVFPLGNKVCFYCNVDYKIFCTNHLSLQHGSRQQNKVHIMEFHDISTFSRTHSFCNAEACLLYWVLNVKLANSQYDIDVLFLVCWRINK
jgi:hypothetical protein